MVRGANPWSRAPPPSEIKFFRKSDFGDAEAESPASSCNESERQSPQTEARPTTTTKSATTTPTAATTLLRDELRAQLKIANPTIAGMLLSQLPWLWSLHFVAELGSDALAAAALATTICNVTGMSLAVGLSSGLSTLTGQAKGDLMIKGDSLERRERGLRLRHEKHAGRSGSCTKNSSTAYYGNVESGYSVNRAEKEEKTESEPLLTNMTKSLHYCSYNSEEAQTDQETNVLIAELVDDLDDVQIQPLVILYRGLFIQLLFVLPIGLWWIRGIQPLLLVLGQGRQLSQMTEAYLRILSPSLWCYSVNFTLSAWLQSIGMADVPPYAALTGLALHIPFNLLFVRLLGFGYEGVAMATTMFQFLQPILICAYLFATAHGQSRMLEHTGAKGIGRTHLGFRREIGHALSSPSGIRQYLGLALPGIVVISEWWASEVCVFLAGRLGPHPAYSLGAMSIYQSINAFCYMFPIGFVSAASARVGMFLGKVDPRRAKLASFVSMAGAMMLSTTMGIILWVAPHGFFPWLFTPDQNVISETSSTIPFLAVYVFADGMQSTLNGILKGCGMQAIAMPIVIVSYWCVGVPLAYYNAFILNDGTSDCHDATFCGTAGLVAGMTVGTWMHFILLLITVLGTIDWQKEAIKARKRVSLR